MGSLPTALKVHTLEMWSADTPLVGSVCRHEVKSYRPQGKFARSDGHARHTHKCAVDPRETRRKRSKGVPFFPGRRTNIPHSIFLRTTMRDCHRIPRGSWIVHFNPWFADFPTGIHDRNLLRIEVPERSESPVPDSLFLQLQRSFLEERLWTLNYRCTNRIVNR